MHYLDIVETLEGYRKEGWGGGQGGGWKEKVSALEE